MSKEAIIVVLATIGPIIGWDIEVLKRPTSAYIHNMLYFSTRNNIGTN